MCFGGPKLKGNKTAPVVSQPVTPPVEQQLPTTQSGADIQNKKKQQKPTNTSLFQIDLTIPSVGAAAGGQGQTGAATR